MKTIARKFTTTPKRGGTKGVVGKILPDPTPQIIPIDAPVDVEGSGRHVQPLREDEFGRAPWFPFRTRADFQATEIAVTGLLPEPLANNLFCRSHVTLKNLKEMEATLESARKYGVRFKTVTISASYNGTKHKITFEYRDPWDWNTRLLEDETLGPHMIFNSVRKYYCEGTEAETFCERIIDEPNTADTWAECESQLPDPDPYPHCALLLHFWLDEGLMTKRLTMHPMVLRGLFLPGNIRNASGNGGGILLGCMYGFPDFGDPSNRSPAENLEYAKFKMKVYQRILRVIFSSLKDRSWSGETLECWDNAWCINATSTDSWRHSNFAPRVTMKAAVRRATKAPTKTEREAILKKNGLHGIDHFLWDFRFSDPYTAYSYDTIHSDDLGKWGHHLWPLLLDVLEGLSGKSTFAEKWPGLKHFNQVTTTHFANGQAFYDILKILPRNSALVHCIRAYQRVRIMTDMHCMPRVSSLYDMNFDFFKQHQTSQIVCDIFQKGTTNHGSTRPSKGVQQEVAEAYNQTNFKNVAHQEAVARIRMVIDKYDKQREEDKREEEPELDENPNPSRIGAGFGTSCAATRNFTTTYNLTASCSTRILPDWHSRVSEFDVALARQAPSGPDKGNCLFPTQDCRAKDLRQVPRVYNIFASQRRDVYRAQLDENPPPPPLNFLPSRWMKFNVPHCLLGTTTSKSDHYSAPDDEKPSRITMVLLTKFQACNLSDHYGAPDEVSGLQSSSSTTSKSDHHCAPDDEKPSRTTIVLLTKFQASNPFLNPNNLQLTSNVCMMVLWFSLTTRYNLELGSWEIIQIFSVFRFDSTSIQPIYQALEIPTTLISYISALESRLSKAFKNQLNWSSDPCAEIFDLGKIPRRPRRAQQWTDFVGRDGELAMVFGSEVDILRTQTTALINSRPTHGHQDPRLLAQIARNFIISLLEPYSGEESAWAAGGESEGSARGWRWGWERPMWLSGCTRSTSPSRPSTTLKTSCAAATSKKPSARVPLDADLADGGRANAYADPYAPYTSPGLEGVEYPWGGEGSYNGHGSTAALPLVANASPFQRADMYDDKGRHGGGHGGRMYGGAQPAHVGDGRARDGVEFWVRVVRAQPKHVWRGRRQDAAQQGRAGGGDPGRRDGVDFEGDVRALAAWHEKLAINVLIWFAPAVPPASSLSCCRVSSERERAARAWVPDEPQQRVYERTGRVVSVVLVKTILKTYGGGSVDNIFPVQVSALCNGVDGGVSPYVVYSPSHNTDQNAIPRLLLLHRRLAARLVL
ncbi:hypothetical protein C8F04DRAFT_1237112 [Mycena alexandri]|uniref:Uncharacterized protein n=1 Tax=Mycena alexandri TaxID=1745969 RepID=A0AAD6SMW4_9AGAR|nr:hypothetical protein C8F04DRAFT_1237112 [Mycena alexandri]